MKDQLCQFHPKLQKTCLDAIFTSVKIDGWMVLHLSEKGLSLCSIGRLNIKHNSFFIFKFNV